MIAFALAAALLTPQDIPPPQRMTGAWSVDLSVRADEPYRKQMVLVLEEDGTVTGEFYDSTIDAGQWRDQNGRLCVFFRTTDGVGPYQTTGCLVDGHMEGQTWAEHRNFVFLWRADRVMDVNAD